MIRINFASSLANFLAFLSSSLWILWATWNFKLPGGISIWMYVCLLLRGEICSEPGPKEWAASSALGRVWLHQHSSKLLFSFPSSHCDSEFMALLLFLSPQLEVEVVDTNGKIIDGPVRLEIAVIDQNDNRPMFKEGPYVGHVMEGSATGESMPLSAQ